MSYTVKVCPICGVQASWESDYDGGWWELGCEHKDYEEWGSLQPIEMPVEPRDPLGPFLAGSRPEALELVAEFRAKRDERSRKERERWEALTPEEQAYELDHHRTMRRAMVACLQSQYEKLPLGDSWNRMVIPASSVSGADEGQEGQDA